MRSLACLALLLVASPAFADERERCVESSDKAPVKFTVERRNGHDVTVIKNEIVFCVHRARPGVAYVTSAKSINYEWESLKQEFLPKTLDSVTKAPF